MAISIPYTFSAQTTISSTQVNDNFSSLLNALDKRGDTLTGNLIVSAGVTIDGVDISAVIGSGGTLLAVDGSAVTNLNATQLTSGTIPDARFPSTLPATSGANLTNLNGSNVSSGTVATGRIASALTGKELTGYSETQVDDTISGNTLTVDMATGNHRAVTLNANISTFTLSNKPSSGKAAAVVLTVTYPDNTTRTIAWPTGTIWPGNAAPTLTCKNGRKDIFCLYFFDGGTVIFGTIIGQNFY